MFVQSILFSFQLFRLCLLGKLFLLFKLFDYSGHAVRLVTAIVYFKIDPQALSIVRHFLYSKSLCILPMIRFLSR